MEIKTGKTKIKRPAQGWRKHIRRVKAAAHKTGTNQA